MTLSLFDWKPPVQMFVFPHARRIGKIRHVANLLEQKNGQEATLYWQTVIRSMSQSLARAGVKKAVIEQEICEFHSAVQAEFCRRANSSSRPTGGDAA